MNIFFSIILVLIGCGFAFFDFAIAFNSVIDQAISGHYKLMVVMLLISIAVTAGIEEKPLRSIIYGVAMGPLFLFSLFLNNNNNEKYVLLFSSIIYLFGFILVFWISRFQLKNDS